MSSGRRGREGGPADTDIKFWSPPMRILVAIPHYFDAEGGFRRHQILKCHVGTV